MPFKKKKNSWCWCLGSAKSKRDAVAFAKAHKIQVLMKGLMADEKISLYYFDESGFSTDRALRLAGSKRDAGNPLFPRKHLKVLGFMAPGNRSFFHAVEGRVGAQQVVAAFAPAYADEYAVQKKPCVVVLDNALTHTSAVFLARLYDWAAFGVLLHYLPPYSPDLIKILWRKIKNEWLPLDCYLSNENLKIAVLDVLVGFGQQYRVTFV